MTDRTNQHFVPQFYFRHFSSDRRTIGALLTRDGRTIPHAPIRGQCARRNFYGSKGLESLFSKLEAGHCAAIRAALDIAHDVSSPDFTPEELSNLFEAIAFQRGRTALEIEKSAPAKAKWRLELFKHHLRHSDVENADEIIHHIDAGNVTVTEPPHASVGLSVRIFLESTLAITDLNLSLIRNRTDYPFIFGDAPVVFYNSYCRNVRNRGVLGLQCPGLQIFFPLDSWTLALLIDDGKYTGPFNEYLQFDVHNRGDVSQLNVLQLHHSLNAVYFGNPQHEEYVQDLWHAHRSSLRTPETKCVVDAEFWVDGRPPEGELMQVFEPQIDYNLKLSFIDYQPVAEADYVFTPRSPELRDELRQRQESWYA